MRQFHNPTDAQTLALAIVDTIPDPFLVLDREFHVLAASRSFYSTFQVDAEQTRGRLLYALGDGQWDIPALRLLLETIIPQHTSMDGFEVEHDFPGLGTRTMILNARMVFYEDSEVSTILLAFKDISGRRAIEREKEALLLQTEELLRQKQVLFDEMQHRVANSLQIIASILTLKARTVTSQESRQHLLDAHQRVISVAEVQAHLHASEGIDRIDARSYLSKLCDSLSVSMASEARPVLIQVEAHEGTMESSRAVSLGLIVTELIINAMKYAFPQGRPDARIRVVYVADGARWSLTVADNGIGKKPMVSSPTSGGLGTNIVKALASQLGAEIVESGAGGGMSVAVSRKGISTLPAGSMDRQPRPSE